MKRYHAFRLQLCQVVLLLVQQVLHFLLVHLHLHLKKEFSIVAVFL